MRSMKSEIVPPTQLQICNACTSKPLRGHQTQSSQKRSSSLKALQSWSFCKQSYHYSLTLQGKLRSPIQGVHNISRDTVQCLKASRDETHRYCWTRSETGKGGETNSLAQFMFTPQTVAVCCIPPAPDYIFASFRLLLSEIIARAGRKGWTLSLLSSSCQLQVPTDISACLWVISACPQKLMDHWSAVRGLPVDYFGTWVQDRRWQDALQLCSSPTYSIALTQACYSPSSFEGLTLSWRVGILHASLFPSLAFECLCPSTGTSCIRVSQIQDQLPSLWDKEQLSNKLTISSPLHDWSCSSKAQELKPSQTITTGHSSRFREQKGYCVFSSTWWKGSLFLACKLFPYQGRVEGEQKT